MEKNHRYSFVAPIYTEFYSLLMFSGEQPYFVENIMLCGFTHALTKCQIRHTYYNRWTSHASHVDWSVKNNFFDTYNKYIFPSRIVGGLLEPVTLYTP